jgi:hypothetical protein
VKNISPRTQSTAAPEPSSGADDFNEVSVVLQTCLPYLRRAQNDDGGWGFTQGTESRVEPTAWAVLALHESFSASDPGGLVADEVIARGFGYLERTQLPDGSWPAAPGQEKGCWATSIACWALLAKGEAARKNLDRALNWLLQTSPGDSGFWWRLLRRLTARRSVSAQNDQLYGWSWTPGTASWVEPTAYALIVLAKAPEELLSSDARNRIAIAKRMLLDRMCPGGGWNCGNPMVYGVAGEPQVTPTVWALLALRGDSGTLEYKKSIDWLEANRSRVQSPASIALTKIALDALGRSDSKSEKSLIEHFRDNEISALSIPTVAWAALAMSQNYNWLKLVMPPSAEDGKG